jgi:hydrogenase maturation protease
MRPNQSPRRQPRDLLLIGYGNTLRGDDGVGVRVAEAVDQWQLPGIRAITCQQLTPELAEAVAGAGQVFFVDAAVDAPREVRLRPLEPALSSQLMAHAADPRTLLAIARDVFGSCPPAWWLTIPIETTHFSGDLSPLARRGRDQALECLRAWMASPNSTPRPGIARP